MAKKTKINNITKEEHIETKGTVIECLPSTRFIVKLENINKTITCTLAGKLRINKITIVEGDSVEVKISPYDVNSGIISWRY